MSETEAENKAEFVATCSLVSVAYLCGRHLQALRNLCSAMVVQVEYNSYRGTMPCEHCETEKLIKGEL